MAKTTRARAYHDGFNDGVLLALQVMTSGGDMGSHQYAELLQAAGEGMLIARAKDQDMLLLSGLFDYLLQRKAGDK